ncbi:MAG: hypothetical protein ACOH18_03420 [Candidatus Saccharimonadaceae bacterium]
MAPHNTVTINGRAYDAVTGLPIESIEVTAPDKTPIRKKPSMEPVKKPQPKTSHGVSDAEIVHTPMQRSQTLLRRGTKKPTLPNKPIIKRSSPGRQMDIARSSNVSRFAKHPTIVTSAPKSTLAPKVIASADKPARVHPMAQRAMNQKTAITLKKAATAKEVKDAEIVKALATPTPKAKKQSKAPKKGLRRFIIIGSIVILLIVALYAAWRLIPTISVSMAAAQAGIEATYPEFTPDGYSLSQPVTYSDGEVDLKFTSNSNDNYYAIKQARSSWDSSAVLDNIVTPAAGANYVTTKERGLTIYTYNTNAAWVNGGILYQIDSKAPLSGDQIRRIATSL